MKLEADSEGRKIRVVRSCSYLDVEGIRDGVLSKEASNLEEGAGTICHMIEVNLAKTFTKALYTFPGSSGSLASGGNCVLKSRINK